MDGTGAALDSGTSPLRQPPAGTCELVVASDLVLLDDVTVPVAQQRRLASSLRFMVEDSAIPDPERLHVATAAQSRKNSLSVGIIDRQWLAEMLARLEQSGLQARSAVPECLLADLQPGAWTIVLTAGGGFARTGRVRGFAMDSVDKATPPVSLSLALDEARGTGSAPERIVLRHAADVGPADAGGWSDALGIPVETGPEWRWTDPAAVPGLDLLQGEFAPRTMDRGLTRTLLPSALLAAALATISLLGIAVDWGVKAHERNALLAEMQRIFRSSFGEAAVVVDAPLQMSRGLSQLRRQAGQIEADDFPALFGLVSERLLDPVKHRIDSVGYGNGMLTLYIRPVDAAQFSSVFRELQSKSSIPGLAVKLEPAESTGRISLQASASPGPKK